MAKIQRTLIAPISYFKTLFVLNNPCKSLVSFALLGHHPIPFLLLYKFEVFYPILCKYKVYSVCKNKDNYLGGALTIRKECEER